MMEKPQTGIQVLMTLISAGWCGGELMRVTCSAIPCKALITIGTREIWDWLSRPEEFVLSESANISVLKNKIFD